MCGCMRVGRGERDEFLDEGLTVVRIVEEVVGVWEGDDGS